MSAELISVKLCEEVLARVLRGGADFAEIFAENSRSFSVDLIDGKTDAVSDVSSRGVGIRGFCGLRTVFASTTDLSRDGLLRCADNVAAVLGESRVPISVVLRKTSVADRHPVLLSPSSVSGSEKVAYARLASEAARVGDEIAQVDAGIADKEREILIANTEGLYVSDKHTRTRISVRATATDGKDTQTGRSSPGSGSGYEFIESTDPKTVGKEAARQALVNLHADYCPAGKMTVAIANGFGGVIFHEACGHSLEATQVGIGASEMCGKLGKVIASEKVTAVDDGTVPNAWGSVNIDDEGNPTQRNVLIEKGVLKTYMIDRLGSRRMGMPMTGNSRRQDFTFEATSRMTNTFIENGTDTNEEIIASMENGLYAASMGGGSVNPLTGEFNFGVAEGYLVKNGKIDRAVRGACLIGKGSEILFDIDMVASDRKNAAGMCGSLSGSVPTEVGQPLIRVKNITVGGRS